MTLKKKIFIISGSVLFFILVLVPCTAIAVLKWGVLPPHKLTPLVLNLVNPMIDGRIECRSMELTLRETFPRVGLKLVDGQIISHTLRDSTARVLDTAHASDTLLRFSEAVVSVQVMDYFRRDRLTIERLSIRDPYFYGFVDTDGRANWDIMKNDGQEEESDTSAMELPLIDLQKVRIRGGHFIYEDLTEDLYVETTGFKLRMKNTLTRGNLNVDVMTGFETLLFESPIYVLGTDLAASLECTLDLSQGAVAFSDAKLTLNELPFTTDGRLEKADAGYMLDLAFDFRAGNVAELLEFVPGEYLNKDGLTTKGSLALGGRVNGILGDSLLPNVSLHLELDKVGLRTKESRHGIERLDTDLDMLLNWNHPDSSFVVFNKLEIEGKNTSLAASGRVDRVFTDPYVDTRLKGMIDFAGILEDILDPDSMVIRGILSADIEAGFRVEEMARGDFSNLKAAGSLEMDRVLVRDRITDYSLFMRGVKFSADTTTQQSRYLTNDDLFSASLTVDTLNVRYRDEIHTGIGKLDMQVKTSRTIDTTAVVPVTSHIRMEGLRARMPDSVWVTGRNVYLAGGLKPSESNKKQGMFVGVITVDTLRYFDIPARTRMTVDKPVFSLEMLPRRDAVRRERQSGGESAAITGNRLPGRTAASEGGPSAEGVTPERTQGDGAADQQPGRAPATADRESAQGATRRERRTGNDTGSDDGTRIGDQVTGSSARTAGQRSVRDTVARASRRQNTSDSVRRSPEGGQGRQSGGFLRNWEVRGNVKFARARGFTGMFPLPLRMENTTLRFDTDRVTLSNAKLRAGKSDFLLNGEVSGMRRAMLRGGVLTAKLSLESDYIDCNQLMRAINRSMLLTEQITADTIPASDEERIVEVWESETSPEAEVDLTGEEGLFVVPANVDIVLEMKAGKVDFDELELANIHGDVIVRNQSVNLRKLNLESNVGHGNVTMAYTARSPKKADVGFELELNDIIVEDLISMFPSIDSLVPMLRSFEGVVDCQMTATCELDSLVNVVFPSLHAACYVNGENMVLMDGETFAEISKKLMFKNKERNLIDYISVDLLVEDNRVEVYPFMVEIDRYKLAVGGMHNLDMSFDYHVSVLKSPVPFKLGIDIRGDLDDFKFKIVKCRYKNIFTPTREQELEQTRLNLRSAIREAIFTELSRNAPELAAGYTQDRVRTRRPEPTLSPDELSADADEPEEDEALEEKYRQYLENIDNPDNLILPGAEDETDGTGPPDPQGVVPNEQEVSPHEPQAAPSKKELRKERRRQRKLERRGGNELPEEEI